MMIKTSDSDPTQHNQKQ